MYFSKVLLLSFFIVAASGAAIPIWELLNHEEKMGRLMYVFMHLVTQYCRNSDIPDCKKVLTLYGMSNLVAQSDEDINLLDPYQRDAKTLIWQRVMKGDFKIAQPKQLRKNNIIEHNSIYEDYDSINEIGGGRPSYPRKSAVKSKFNNPHPYAIRVPAPSKYFTTTVPSTTTAKTTTTGIAAEITTEVPLVEMDPYEQYLDGRSTDFETSHPYAVRAFPPRGEESQQSGIKHSVDFEPVMSESRHVEESLPFIQILPPRSYSAPSSSNSWVRRTVQKQFRPRFS